jgi:hypothetical protein
LSSFLPSVLPSILPSCSPLLLLDIHILMCLVFNPCGFWYPNNSLSFSLRWASLPYWAHVYIRCHIGHMVFVVCNMKQSNTTKRSIVKYSHIDLARVVFDISKTNDTEIKTYRSADMTRRADIQAYRRNYTCRQFHSRLVSHLYTYICIYVYLYHIYTYVYDIYICI